MTSLARLVAAFDAVSDICADLTIHTHREPQAGNALTMWAGSRGLPVDEKLIGPSAACPPFVRLACAYALGATFTVIITPEPA